MARLACIAPLVVIVACSRPQPTPERTPAASSALTVADAAPSADAAATTDASAGVREDAAPPSKVKPQVRAKKWVCDEQACEGWSSFAYDYLPAVTTDGAIAAVVEERDGWGHVPDPGVRFVDTRTSEGGASLEFHALAQGKRDLGTYEAFAKRKSELEGIVAKANAALDAKSWITLLPAGDPLTFMQHEGKWVKIDAEDGKCVACTFESRWTALGVTVALVTSSPSFGDGVAPKSVKGAKVTVDGKVVLEKKVEGAAPLWPVKAGCSERKLVLLGVRRDPNVALLRETNGSTTHACDGKREPQEVRALRW